MCYHSHSVVYFLKRKEKSIELELAQSENIHKQHNQVQNQWGSLHLGEGYERLKTWATLFPSV